MLEIYPVMENANTKAWEKQDDENVRDHQGAVKLFHFLLVPHKPKIKSRSSQEAKVLLLTTIDTTIASLTFGHIKISG